MEKIYCPLHKCQYNKTALKTAKGYQAWEVLLKLVEPDLSVAFEIAGALGFDIGLMAELLPAGVQGIKDGLCANAKIYCTPFAMPSRYSMNAWKHT